MYIKWKRIIILSLDALLAVYLVLAITSWNKPSENGQTCNKVNINISDANNAGFLSATEVKVILSKANLYPLNQKMSNISPRRIEDALKTGPFVNTAECYKTQNGEVVLNITQRMPIVRIKSDNGDDYYLDDNGGILPNSKYTSDLIIATGKIDKHFAQYYLASLAKVISASPLWVNQIEQINVLPDKGIELIPRVGNNIIFLGYLPFGKYKSERDNGVRTYVQKKLDRLEKFYRYGISKVGWNLYSYIDLQYDNQIVCKKAGGEIEKEPEEKEKQDTGAPKTAVEKVKETDPLNKKDKKTEESHSNVPMAEEGPID